MRLLALLLCLVFLTGYMTTVFAEDNPGEGVPLGKLYLSWNPVTIETECTPIPYQPFHLYILTDVDYGDIGLPEQNELNGLFAWEASMILPENLLVNSVDYYPLENGAYNFCNFPIMCVGTGGSLFADTMPRLLAILECVVLETMMERVELFFGPSDPGSFMDPVPGWAEFAVSGECTLPNGYHTNCIRPFAELGNVFVGPTDDVALPAVSWSAVKALY